MVAVIVPLPVLVAVNAGRELPDPPAPSPIDVLEFVHAKVVPLTVPLNVSVFTGTFVLLQYTWLPGTVTVGVGLTVIANVDVVGEAAHPFADEVKV